MIHAGYEGSDHCRKNIYNPLTLELRFNGHNYFSPVWFCIIIKVG